MTEEMEKLQIPRHLGMILDGNGRWAEKRGLPRTAGHVEGTENVVRMTRACSKRGIRVLSLYAFSTENWKRSAEEVGALMKLIVRFVNSYLEELDRNQIRLETMGDLSRLPRLSRLAVEQAKKRTRNNSGMVLNIALNYGGRDEIVRGVNRWLSRHPAAAHICEEDLDRELDTAAYPPLDLIIRTGGEERLSNFMLWQAAYAEFYFTPVLWPDFSEAELDKAIAAFSQRNRRFGGVK